jgi:hypothetical protein
MKNKKNLGTFLKNSDDLTTLTGIDLGQSDLIRWIKIRRLAAAADASGGGLRRRAAAHGGELTNEDLTRSMVHD